MMRELNIVLAVNINCMSQSAWMNMLEGKYRLKQKSLRKYRESRLQAMQLAVCELFPMYVDMHAMPKKIFLTAGHLDSQMHI